MLLALDISTTCCGIAIFDEKYKLHELSHIKFRSKEGLFKKLNEFIEHFQKYKEISFTQIAIEEPLKRFAGKFSNADTIQKLTQMNSLISGYLYLTLKIEPVYYNVLHARKIAFPGLVIPKEHPNKKYLIWECVMKMEPVINWVISKRTGKLADENFDMCDAYVIGLSHIVSSIQSKAVDVAVEKSA
jgi:hypothetical protein